MMCLLRWSIWCILLTLHMSACAMETYGYGSDEVICSQGLSHCTMKNEIPLPLPTENEAVNVQNLMARFSLCCKDGVTCVLCLMIDMEINIHPDKFVEDEGNSGFDEEYYDEERNPKASVTACYKEVTMWPLCKKVEFTVNLTQQNQAKLSIVITKPAGVHFSSQVTVYSPAPKQLSQTVSSPSRSEVCSQVQQELVEECHVPRFSCVMNQEMKQVELQFDDWNKSLPSICVQYEENGTCQFWWMSEDFIDHDKFLTALKWTTSTIPLYSVTPCICFQVWDEDDQRSSRAKRCPFNNTDSLRRNIWQNVSVNVGQGRMYNGNTMLSWNVSAPCRLEGEVWPCRKESSCKEMKEFRQQLEKGVWSQNSKGKWEIRGVFEDISLQFSPCVMVKVKGMNRELGPFCFNNTDRWHWSLLVVGVMLLVCLTVLLCYLLHDFVKNWVWSWHHGGFVQIGTQRHVVLLSPPDVDNGVSESVCQLGSLLCNKGFSVSVDQWSRRELCSLGPLPWLHSQMLDLKSQGGRVVQVLTRKALERAEEWTHQNKEIIKTKEDKDVPQTWSPYSDVFTASLFVMQADKELGRAGERFILVMFDSHGSSDKTLPEPLQGLPLFHYPSQTRALLTELTVGQTHRGQIRTHKYPAEHYSYPAHMKDTIVPIMDGINTGHS